MLSLDEERLPWDNLKDVEDNPYEWDALGQIKVHNPISDANNLYASMMLARKGTAWKGDEIGLFTNQKKTVYVRTDKWFVWLKRKYRLRSDGRVEMKILPRSVTLMKRRLRRQKKKVDEGKFTAEYIAGIAKSWLCARYDVMSYPQVRSMEKLILNLYGRAAYEHVYDRTERWKAHRRRKDERGYVCSAGRNHDAGS